MRRLSCLSSTKIETKIKTETLGLPRGFFYLPVVERIKFTARMSMARGGLTLGMLSLLGVAGSPAFAQVAGQQLHTFRGVRL